jgi:signal transduction histidine kinase
MNLNIPFKFKSVYLSILFLSCITGSVTAQPLQLSQHQENDFIGEHIEFLIDSSAEFSADNILDQPFSQSQDPVLNLGFSDKPIWLRMSFENARKMDDFFLSYAFPLVDSLSVYSAENGALQLRYASGANYLKSERPVHHQYFLFKFKIGAETGPVTVYLRMKSNGQLIIPMTIANAEQSISNLTASDYFKGMFYGILIAMILYNLVISFFIKDRSYYYYVGYISFLTVSQAMLDGYLQRYVLGDWEYIQHVLVIMSPSLAGFFALYFAQVFLQVKSYSKNLNRGILALQAFYLSIAFLSFFPSLNFLYRLVDIASMLVAVYTLVFSSVIARTGSRPARFFLIAFTTLLLSLVVFVFRNVGILPYGFFTNNVLQLGFTVQVILLSIALADRINALRKEKELSQEEALKAAHENQNLIKRQNAMLEQRVQERTIELEESNEELRVTLDNLKETQTQLVDAEKMASLGQLTAGIAHEINNPINFVTSNISPLRRDLDDIYEILDAYSAIEPDHFEEQFKIAKEKEEDLEYSYLKTEINSLVNGISDGANRTSEIVKGLRTFSRLDEDVVKQADLHENLESTMVLLNNKVKDGIQVIRDFDKSIGDIECYPGKLNQVFMNILNNSIYAVENKIYQEGEKPMVTLKTERKGSEVLVTISDNGIGMSPETQKKIFDPFFTTKEVGEGTGLGMSIVFKIIQKHNGSIRMQSEEGKGTDFIIHLPVTQPSEF